MTQIPPDLPFATPDSVNGVFSQVVAVVLDSRVFLTDLMTQMADVSTLGEQRRNAVEGARTVVYPRADALVTAIRSGEYAVALHEHALGDDDPGWELKYTGYTRARERYTAVRSAPTGTGQSGVRSVLRAAKRPLRWLNVILGSLADVIPGAGGALKELKESNEATIDDVLEDAGEA